MAEVVENYTLAEIPLETVVIDTEAWSNIEIFTLSEGYPLPAFQNFVSRLHSRGQRWVRTTVTLYLVSLVKGTRLCFYSSTRHEHTILPVKPCSSRPNAGVHPAGLTHCQI